MVRAPQVIVLAGPNGAGKSTSAPTLIAETLGITEFVNADVIAQGLSAFRRDSVAREAGRIMLTRLDELGRRRADFAFETTLASRTFAPRIAALRRAGYQFHPIFLWLPSADLAVLRVRRRVSEGGHDVPEETIRRRYKAGLTNFFRLYLPLADSWAMYNVSTEPKSIIAEDHGAVGPTVFDRGAWILAQTTEAE